MPTPISDKPITAITVPTTTGGKKRSNFPIIGARKIPTTPAAIVAPNTSRMPSPGFVPIATIGPTAANVQPMMTGKRMPKIQRPNVWISVATPQENRSALMRNAIWSFGSLSAAPRISGTATAPAYITSTC